MGEPAVVNASPLIFLARGNLFHLLRLTGDRVVVPTAVAEEIRRRGLTDSTVVAVESSDWVDVVEAGSVPPVIQAWDLGPGESAVLAWATAHPGAEAILDEPGRAPVRSHPRVSVRGTLGLLLLARRRGVVPAARPLLETLRGAGMNVSLARRDGPRATSRRGVTGGRRPVRAGRRLRVTHRRRPSRRLRDHLVMLMGTAAGARASRVAATFPVASASTAKPRRASSRPRRRAIAVTSNATSVRGWR